MIKKDDASSSFTLIELLIVVAIIAILATIIVITLNQAFAQARDVKRQQDLKNMQKVVEEYYMTNQNYPVTTTASPPQWEAGCTGGQGTLHALSGASSFIPNVTPAYLSVLPIDPRQGIDGSVGGCTGGADANACYSYASNGAQYKLEAWKTVEYYPATATNNLSQFYDPARCGSYSLTNNYAQTQTW